MENNIDNIKKMIKVLKTSDNTFIQGCIKHYRKNKSLTDRQFQIFYELYMNEII